MSLTTPLYNLKEFPDVYEPSEDTFLLLDALEIDIGSIIERNPNFVIEIGSGSGIVITALTASLRNTQCFATDINPEACAATNRTANLNNTFIEICNMNLLSCFKAHLFDIIIFNPPYVITNSTEIAGNGIARAWAGGVNGREIIDEFLKLLPQNMSSSGVCYMVIIKENRPEEVIDIIEKMNLKVIVLKERRVLGEHLYVLKIYKV